MILTYPFILSAMLQTSNFEPSIVFIDSRDDQKTTYLIINGTCKLRIKKTDLRDYDKIVDLAVKKCGL